MNVCGIDPGLGVTGYAVLRFDGQGPVILDAGVITTDASAPLAARLVRLADDFSEIMTQWRPEVVGLESLYAHYNHPRTAIQMGHARGVLMQTAARLGADMRSFAATHIKRYLTGNGHASKSQVQRAAQTVFGLAQPPEPNDVADALAVAYCCCREVNVSEAAS